MSRVDGVSGERMSTRNNLLLIMQGDDGRIDGGGGSPRDDTGASRLGGWGHGPGAAAWAVKQLIRPPARPHGRTWVRLIPSLPLQARSVLKYKYLSTSTIHV